MRVEDAHFAGRLFSLRMLASPGSCEILANDLMQYHGVPAVRIHGDMAQYERTGALEAMAQWHRSICSCR